MEMGLHLINDLLNLILEILLMPFVNMMGINVSVIKSI
jgi:hypothetical protein